MVSQLDSVDIHFLCSSETMSQDKNYYGKCGWAFKAGDQGFAAVGLLTGRVSKKGKFVSLT